MKDLRINVKNDEDYDEFIKKYKEGRITFLDGDTSYTYDRTSFNGFL